MNVYGKIYGNEKTSLELSEKAFKVYSNTDYLQLEEFYDDWYGDD